MHTIALFILAGSIVFLGVCIYACAGVINACAGVIDQLSEALLSDMTPDDEERY